MSETEDIAHDEQIAVWADVILRAIAEYIRDDINDGDVVSVHSAVRDELRGIVDTVADGHPEIAAQLSAAIAERDAARGETAKLRSALGHVDVVGFNIDDAKAAKNELELAFLKDGRSWRITALNREMALQAYISICLVLDNIDATTMDT